ncbi:diacylglycerol kinase [Pusillimonas sp. TS35]|uniref:diacylglycerol kinase n=1 Tax=Paracandidimonas lactea TaxID=2895524 RepID=UPI00136DE393|nr:diacylglycerol kinase [Paracandidimonas lactea]MYN12873.1 diacylglycerol kinase [Pusillimonas sp. TS35]
MHSSYKSKGGLARLVNAARYSMQGLAAACRHEAAFRQELLLVVALLPLALWLGHTWLEVALLVASLIFVLIVELINSAIEALADKITTEHHPLIGRAKDLGSAAVLLSLALAAIVWAGIIASHVASAV